MPSWVASVPRLTSLCSTNTVNHLVGYLRLRHACQSYSAHLRCRSTSTYVSPTAINYRPNIPPKHKELYNALSELSVKAEQYVNISRLQLALRGLTVGDAVTRIAVLGINSQIGARRLVRVLLADPLAEEEQWEGELQRGGDEGAVLLRFGDRNDVHSPSPLYQTVSIPSRTLRTHNLEILVSALLVDVVKPVVPSVTDTSTDALLVPALQATSARGLPVPFPVHKTLVLGEGLDGAITYGKFTADNPGITDMLKVAIDLPPPAKEVEYSHGTRATQVNLDIGIQALNALRTSVQNATVYERNWFASNIPTLSNWLTQDLELTTPTASIKPVHASFISSILDNIEENITRDDARQLVSLKSTTSNPINQYSGEMTTYVEAWAERAHEELRDGLEEAFASRNWRKLAWWKLFWRVDDVGMVLEEVLERRWLVNAERDVVFLAGRMKQAGFSDIMPQTSAVETTHKYFGAVKQQELADPLPTLRDMRTDSTTEVKQQIPWPTILSATRNQLLFESLPPLHALAQRLILTTISTTSLSSALSALVYVSVESFSIFETSAIAALGTVFALHRMQKIWEGAREGWMERVREEGRQALKETDRVVKTIVGKSPMRQVVQDTAQEKRQVKEVVQRAREVLQRMSGR